MMAKTQHRALVWTLALSTVLAAAGCHPRSDARSDRVDPSTPQAPVDLNAVVLSAAKAYRSYPRVSNAANWAPELCIAVRTDPRMSDATPGSPHGRKLYHLYAKQAEDYLRTPSPSARPTSRVGQVLVKEAFTPETDAQGRPVLGAPAGLFVMALLDPATPGTDQGWVYGVTTPDHKAVIEAGAIASCMKCHEQTGPGRLFGLRDVK
jgi:hypothetical protein